MSLNLRTILGLGKSGHITTCFFTGDDGQYVGYGMPIFLAGNNLLKDINVNDEDFPKPALPSGKTYRGFLVVPFWSYRNGIKTSGTGDLFYPSLMVSTRNIKIWEEDSILNHISIDEVDHVSELPYLKNSIALGDAVHENGFIFATPRNMKAFKDMNGCLKGLVGAHNFSLLHSFYIRTNADTRAKGKKYFSSNLYLDKHAVIVPIFFAIDLKYCLPFYDARNNGGIFAGWFVLVTALNNKEPYYERVAHFSFFVSNFEEGIFTVDCQKIHDTKTYRVGNYTFSEIEEVVTKTFPFKPSILLPGNNGNKETIKQVRTEKGLKTFELSSGETVTVNTANVYTNSIEFAINSTSTTSSIDYISCIDDALEVQEDAREVQETPEVPKPRPKKPRPKKVVKQRIQKLRIPKLITPRVMREAEPDEPVVHKKLFLDRVVEEETVEEESGPFIYDSPVDRPHKARKANTEARESKESILSAMYKTRKIYEIDASERVKMITRLEKTYKKVEDLMNNSKMRAHDDEMTIQEVKPQKGQKQKVAKKRAK